MSISCYDDIIYENDIIDYFNDTLHNMSIPDSDKDVARDGLEEFEGVCGWGHGCLSFINAGYFPEYAREIASEFVSDPLDNWPLSCINWEEASEVLMSDYECVNFEGCYFYTGG